MGLRFSMEWLWNEIQQTDRLAHSNIVKVFDLLITGNTHVFITVRERTSITYAVFLAFFDSASVGFEYAILPTGYPHPLPNNMYTFLKLLLWSNMVNCIRPQCGLHMRRPTLLPVLVSYAFCQTPPPLYATYVIKKSSLISCYDWCGVLCTKCVFSLAVEGGQWDTRST